MFSLFLSLLPSFLYFQSSTVFVVRYAGILAKYPYHVLGMLGAIYIYTHPPSCKIVFFFIHRFNGRGVYMKMGVASFELLEVVALQLQLLNL